MARYGMLIDTTKCIGCYTCRLACQRQNGLEPDETFVRFEDRETGTYPQVGVEHVPLQCMHCEDAPCTKVCPTGAAHIGTDGIVQVDQGRCIGCLYCMAACPYQVRVRNSKTGSRQVPLLPRVELRERYRDVHLRDGLPDPCSYLRRLG